MFARLKEKAKEKALEYKEKRDEFRERRGSGAISPTLSSSNIHEEDEDGHDPSQHSQEHGSDRKKSLSAAINAIREKPGVAKALAKAGEVRRAAVSKAKEKYADYREKRIERRTSRQQLGIDGDDGEEEGAEEEEGEEEEGEGEEDGEARSRDRYGGPGRRLSRLSVTSSPQTSVRSAPVRSGIHSRQASMADLPPPPRALHSKTSSGTIPPLSPDSTASNRKSRALVDFDEGIAEPPPAARAGSRSGTPSGRMRREGSGVVSPVGVTGTPRDRERERERESQRRPISPAFDAPLPTSRRPLSPGTFLSGAVGGPPPAPVPSAREVREAQREAVRRTFRIPPIPMDLDEDGVLRHVQGLLAAVEDDLREAVKRKETQWNEERELMDEMLKANLSKRAILVKEVEKLKAQLMKSQTGVERRPGESSGSAAGRMRGLDIDKLIEELQRVKALERRTEDDVVKTTRALASCPEDEKDIWETKVGAHRDTLKLIKQQILTLEAKVRVLREEDARSDSSHSGWQELNHLNDELNKIEAQIDSIKRLSYFPEYQGWQVRLGSAGVYLGAKDIVVSKISGGFRAVASRFVRKNSAEQYVVVSMSLGASSRTGRAAMAHHANSAADLADDDLNAGYDDAHSLFSALEIERVTNMTETLSSHSSQGRGGGGGAHHRALSSSTFSHDSDAGASSWLDLASVEPSRADKGLVVVLRTEQLQLKADRGTRVPDLAFKELALRIDVSADVDLEYSTRLGWRVPGSVNITVHSIEKESKGGTLPIPTSQIGALLPLILPPILKKVLPRLLPPEIGDYLVQSHTIDEGSDPLLLRGSVAIQGPDLDVLMADLGLVAQLPAGAGLKAFAGKAAMGGAANGASKVAGPLLAALRVLDLEPSEAVFLEELYCKKLKCSSDFSNRTILTLQELIRYHKKISRSDRVFEMTCTLWEQVLEFYKSTIDFRSLMERVGKMSDEKPVRLKLSIQELSIEVDADAAITQMHRFFVRVARELHSGLRQKKKGAEPTQPIHQQLRAADDWLSMVSALLARYKEGFGGARTSAIISLQPGAPVQAMVQNLSYEGPLDVQIPMGTSEYPGGPLMYDISFPGLSKQKAISRIMLACPDIPDEIKREGLLVKVMLDGASFGLRLDMDALAKALLPAAPELTRREDYTESQLMSLIKACTSSYASLASFTVERGETTPPPALDPHLGSRDAMGLKVSSNELARIVLRAERLRVQTELTAAHWARVAFQIMLELGVAKEDFSPAWFHPVDNLNLSLQIPIKAARSKKNHLCARIGYSEGLADGGPVNDRGNNPLGPQVMQLDLSTEVDWKRILVLKEIGEGALRTRPSLVSKVLNRKEGAPLVERKKKSMGAVSSLMGGLRK